MKTLILLVAIIAMLGGCLMTVTAPGHLYPVRGPLSKVATPPIYSATLTGGISPSGSITVRVADGVTCPGVWKAVPADEPTARQMSHEWDEVYGSGYFVAHVLGKRTFARSALTCTNSEKLNLEFLVVEPGKPSSTIGVVADETGNIFKLSF